MSQSVQYSARSLDAACPLEHVLPDVAVFLLTKPNMALERIDHKQPYWNDAGHAEPMKSNDKVSPLKRPTQRLPGESIKDQMKVVRDKFFSEAAMPAGLFTAVAGLEWIRHYSASPPNPWLITSMAVIALIWAGLQFIRTRQKLERLELGRQGEIAVAQALSLLKSDGYELLNDLVGNDWNIDHVLIGPSGVYTIETKMLMKPRRGLPIIQHMNNRLLLGKLDLSGHLIQAKAQSNTIRQLFEDHVGGHYSVQPVVVFPGWYIEGEGHKENNIWVLEPRAFLKWVHNTPKKLTDQQIKNLKHVLLVEFN